MSEPSPTSSWRPPPPPAPAAWVPPPPPTGTNFPPLPPPPFRWPRPRWWHFVLLALVALGAIGWKWGPWAVAETFFREPTPEWAQLALADTLPAQAPILAHAAITLDPPRILRIGEGHARLIATGTATLREALYEVLDGPAAPTLATVGAKPDEFHATITRYYALHPPVDWDPPDLSRFRFAHASQPVGQSLDITAEFTAERTGFEWQVAPGGTVKILPSPSTLGMVRAELPGDAALADAPTSPAQIREMLGLIQSFTQSVADEEARRAARQQATAAAAATETLSVDRAEAERAIRRMLPAVQDAWESNDPERLLDFYADTVDYQDHGRVGRDFIRRDLVNYYDRWPERRGSINGNVQLLPADSGAGRWTARFNISVRVESPDRNEWVRGSFALTYEIEVTDRPRITRVRETVNNREKGALRRGVTPSSANPLPAPRGNSLQDRTRALDRL